MRKGEVCRHCDKVCEEDGIDPCLGRLPGVKAACCGHAGKGGKGAHTPYIIFDNNIVINDFDTVNFYNNGKYKKDSYKVVLCESKD